MKSPSGNICAPLDLALAWFILGALLWAKHAGAGRLALGTACILFATLTYQTYLTIVPMLLLYEVSCNLLRAAPLKLSAIAKKLSLLAAVALFEIGYMVVSRDPLGYSSERGFVTATWPGAYVWFQ
jgi:hypothetical protein